MKLFPFRGVRNVNSTTRDEAGPVPLENVPGHLRRGRCRIPAGLLGLLMVSGLLSLTTFAAVTPYSWIRGGEAGSVQADSSGNNRAFNAAFSRLGGGNPAAVIVPTGVGGPLGGAGGPVSSITTRWGFYNVDASGMWVQGSGGGVPPLDQWGLPPINWAVECWVLPIDTGAPLQRTTSQFLSTGSAQFGGVPGGVAFRTTYFPETVDENDFDIIIPARIEVRVDSIGPLPADNFTIGNPADLSVERWTHLAAVNVGGVVTFYVNGVASGDPSSEVTAPSGVPYIGSGQDTNNPFNGYLDEIRFSTFAAGAFSVSDLLLRPAGPSILSQPESATVWAGGPVPFQVDTVIEGTTAYQWKKGVADVAGATGNELYLPAVTPADSGGTYSVVITDSGGSLTSSVATLTVEAQETANVDYYRAAVQAEAGLVSFFPVDGSTAGTITNAKNAGLPGTLADGASYDGRTNRSFGERALRFQRSNPGTVTVPTNDAFDFPGGNGTVEALVYLQGTPSLGQATLMTATQGPGTEYWQIAAGLDGLGLFYDNDVLEQPVTWAVPVSLVGRQAHVAVVFTPGFVTAYVDGISLGTKANGSFGSSPGSPVVIGSGGMDFDGTFGTPWNGTIDEIAIYSTALSANTIAVHNSRFVYGTAVEPPVTGVQPAGTFDLLAGGAPAFQVDVTGTAPLTYQWNLNGNPVQNNPTATTRRLVLNNSTVAMSGSYTLTVSNDVGSDTTDPFTVNLTAPTGTYAGFVLEDNPSAYWRLNETSGTVLKDYAGGLDGVYSSTVELGVPGAPGITPDTAMKLAGTGTPTPNAVVPFSPTLNPGTAFSLEVWVKPDQAGNLGRAVVGNQNRNTGRAGYALYQGFNVNGWESHIGFGESVLFLQGTTPPAVGRWDHIVVTWDGSNIAQLYVNGVLEATATGGPHRPNQSVPFEIGSRSTNTIPYPGTVDELAFYNHALTLEQIRKHWSIAWTPAAITQQPAATVDAVEAGSFTLEAAASGYPNSYQWLKDGEALTAFTNPDGSAHYPQGFNSPTLAINQSSPLDAGVYQLVITNPLGNQTTTSVTVAVAPDTTPPVATLVSADPSLRRVRVGYNRWVTPETASVPANYQFTGGLVASSVVLTSDPAVVNVVLANPMTPGATYSLSISGVRDQRSSGNLIAANATPFRAYELTQGVLSVDFYAGIGGTSVGELLNDAQYPDGIITSTSVNSFSTMPLTGGNLVNNPTYAAFGLGENYATRMSGWITPGVSGNYTFFIRSDDASELYLSTDDDSANLELIAFEGGCCQAFLEPGAVQTSLPIALTAGTRYYVEALQKEGGGGDFVEVAWRREGDTTPAGELTPIPAEFLSAFASIQLTGMGTPTLVDGQVVITWGGPGKLQESPDLQTWTDVPGNPVSPYVTPAAGARFYRLLP